jgi:DNA-binding response OmpR family regulator
VPILVVCDQAEEVEIVGLLAAGADDCVRRTIGEIELAGRILSAARRAGAAPYHGTSSPSSRKSHRVSTLRAGGVRLDLTTCRVSVGAKTCTLTPNEFRLMAVFLRSPGEVFSREDLRRRVWPNDVHSLHLIEVHIANLRAKIEIDPHRPNHILTVRSRGYKFAVKS